VTVRPGFPLSALLRYYGFRPPRTTFGTYVSPTRTIPLGEPDRPPYVHEFGPTRGPAFTIRETLPPFVTAPWVRTAQRAAADARTRERYHAYLADAVARQRIA
jgi:hypothetical protein